jgi:hypothetical protein
LIATPEAMGKKGAIAGAWLFLSERIGFDGSISERDQQQHTSALKNSQRIVNDLIKEFGGREFPIWELFGAVAILAHAA